MSTYHGDDHTPRTAEGSSKDAGEHLALTGKTSHLKNAIREVARMTGAHGLTTAEFSRSGVRPSAHHGQVSSAFSTMHETGHLARLQERRDRYEIYVLPEHVNGRATREHASIARARKRDALIEILEWAENEGVNAPNVALTVLVDEVNTYIGRDQS